MTISLINQLISSFYQSTNFWTDHFGTLRTVITLLNKPSVFSTSRREPSSPPGGPRLSLGVPPYQEAERGTARPTRLQEGENRGGRAGRSGNHQQQQRH